MAMGGVVSRKVPTPPNLPKEFAMEPRIYTYRVTFEETPDWYWGAHKEKKYGEPYLGSPDTHAWKWDTYTPSLEICELFPYTDEGWAEARKVEDRCILPDLNNPLCLNEHVGGFMSLQALRRGAKKVHEEKDDLGRSLHALKLHEEKDDLGKSVRAIKLNESIHEEKDNLGRSAHAIRTNKIIHEEKDELGRSVNAVKAGTAAHQEKDEFGRSVTAVKAGEKGGKKGAKTMNAQKWEDPDHPELGEHSSGTLAQMQRARGYPHGPENRERVYPPDQRV